MPRFAFRLDSVLRLRVHAEQRQQRVLADAQLHLQQLQHALLTIESQIAAASSQLKQHVSEGHLDPRWLLMHAHHTQELRVRAASLSDDIFHAGLAVESARESLVVASAQRKSLEKLRDRQLEQFVQSQDRSDRRTQDEIAARVAQQK